MAIDLARFLRLLCVLTIAAAGAASTSRADDPAAAEVLKSRGLKASGRTMWVLPGETPIPRKVKQLGDLSRQLKAAQMQQQQLETGPQNPQVLMASYREQVKLLEQRLDAYDEALANFGPTLGNPALVVQRNAIVDERNTVVLAHRRLVALMNRTAEDKQQFQETKQQFTTELARLRESYTQGIEDIRKSVDELKAKYDELNADEAVKKALADLSGSSKIKHKLGPSKTHEDAIALLKRFESSIKSETIELHRENGVDKIDVTLNGKETVRMVFDTGAGPTLLSAALAERLALRPTGRTIACTTADGTQVMAKEMVIRSVVIGRLTVKDVTCTVMPNDKGNVEPLFGQSILQHFDFRYTQGSGRLVLSKVEPEEPAAKKKRGSR
jgi:clan AA aspartic protease (TIGR02281 family)